MSDPANTPSTPPGWYTDPSGLPRQRWWDGTHWTEHLHDPALEKYGVTPAKVVGSDTPVYNWFIWLITLLPLLSISAVASWDMTAYMLRSSSGVAALDPSYLLLQFLGLAVYAGSVALAFADWRALGRDGYVRPFHWAWAFLSGSVYVVGRSIIVYRRAGSGLWPIWVLAALTILGIGLMVAKLSEAMPALMSTLPGY